MNNQTLTLTGIDFLIMAQNGTLKVETDTEGNILGINVADEFVDRYDGLLVAIYEYQKLMQDISFNLIRKALPEKELPEIEINENEDIENK